jgi:HK97 family phage prohead protease
MIYDYKQFDLEVKDVDKKQGIVSGYFSAFNIKDSDGDIIHPGAFARSIKDWGPEGKNRIKHLKNHDPGTPLGKLIELKEDGFGLHYTSKVGTHDAGKDFIKMVESQLITEHSIGFKDVTPKELKDNGNGANNMTDLILYEGSSLTAWGAQENTPLTGYKSSVKYISERLEKFEKFVRNTDATDETIELCLIYIKQLEGKIEAMSNTQPAVEAVGQRKGDNDAMTAINLLILKHF